MGEALNHIHQNTKSARLIAVNKEDEAISIYQSPGLISKILKHITITIYIKITPLYDITYAISDSRENLRFDKEDYFHVFNFYGLFI